VGALNVKLLKPGKEDKLPLPTANKTTTTGGGNQSK